MNLLLLGLALFFHPEAERGLLRSETTTRSEPSRNGPLPGKPSAETPDSRWSEARNEKEQATPSKSIARSLSSSPARVGAARGDVNSPAPQVYAALVTRTGVFALERRNGEQGSATAPRTEQLWLGDGRVLTVSSHARGFDAALPSTRGGHAWTLVTPGGACLVERADPVTLHLQESSVAANEGDTSDQPVVLEGSRLVGCNALARFGDDATERALAISGPYPAATYEALHRGSLGSVFTLGEMTVVRRGPLPCANEGNSVILTADRQTPLATHRGFVSDAWVNLPDRELLVLESTTGSDVIRVLEVVGTNVRQIGESPRSPLWSDSAVC